MNLTLGDNPQQKLTIFFTKSFGLSALLLVSSSLPSLAQLPSVRPSPVRVRPIAPVNVSPPPPPITPNLPNLTENVQLQEASYTLGAGDRLNLDIFGVPEFSKEYQVLVDGTLNLPIIRTVSVEGLTLLQAAEVVRRRYEPYINNPVVTLTLIAARPLTIGVAGEVSRPGSYKVSVSREGESVKFPTLIEILQLAKGVTPTGNLRGITIIRRQRGVPNQEITVNLQQFLQTGDLSQDITLRDGDTIFVPPATEINTQEVRQRANANFSADITQPIGVVIVGEVNRPGPYTVFASDLRSTNQERELSFVSIDQQQGTLVGLPTVTRAIKIAGGITLQADIRQVQIRRRPKIGPEQIITVDLWDLLQTGDVNQDVLLQEGDSIIVPTAETVDVAEISQIASTSFSPNSIQVNIVGEVSRPGIVEVSPSTSLHQALLTAGSFNAIRAENERVELLRLNPNGTVTRRRIDVDFSRGLNLDNNPTLRNNDVIIVTRGGLARIADSLNRVLLPITAAVGIINGVSGAFTGVETTIKTFERLFLGGDLQQRLQLEQNRRQIIDRQRQIELQEQQLRLQNQLQNQIQNPTPPPTQNPNQNQTQDQQQQLQLQNQQLQIQQLQLQQLQTQPQTTPNQMQTQPLTR